MFWCDYDKVLYIIAKIILVAGHTSRKVEEVSCIMEQCQQHVQELEMSYTRFNCPVLIHSTLMNCHTMEYDAI